MTEKAVVLVLVIGGATVAFAQTGRLQPAHLEYRGAFAFPAGDEWAYSGGALAYYPAGDPGGAGDGFPGSLIAAGHDQVDLVGEISIPAPAITSSFSDLPRAAVVTGMRDITGGLLAATCGACPSCDCEAWNVDGLEYVSGVDRVAWNLRDWYNAGAVDLESLGWSYPNLGGAVGVWHIGPRPNETWPQPFHNAKTCNYLFSAPTAFADQYLGGRSLVAGNHRESGSHGGSQGPTMVATAPWLDGNPPAAGADLGATALVFYPWVEACTYGDYGQCHYPGYRVDDDWGGGAWVEAGGAAAVLVFGLKGLGDNCYGTPGVNCPTPACSPYQGWHSDPYEPQILFFDPAEMAEVAAGSREPWQVLPYAVYSPVGELFDPDCGRMTAVSYDSERRRIFVAEREAGPSGETAVHVWEVRGPLFADGFETGDTSRWSDVSQ